MLSCDWAVMPTQARAHKIVPSLGRGAVRRLVTLVLKEYYRLSEDRPM
jgi:hypothetical protein